MINGYGVFLTSSFTYELDRICDTVYSGAVILHNRAEKNKNKRQQTVVLLNFFFCKLDCLFKLFVHFIQETRST